MKDETSIELDNVAGLPKKGIAIIKTDAEEFVVDHELIIKAIKDKKENSNE